MRLIGCVGFLLLGCLSLISSVFADPVDPIIRQYYAEVNFMIKDWTNPPGRLVVWHQKTAGQRAAQLDLITEKVAIVDGSGQAQYHMDIGVREQAEFVKRLKAGADMPHDQEWTKMWSIVDQGNSAWSLLSQHKEYQSDEFKELTALYESSLEKLLIWRLPAYDEKIEDGEWRKKVYQEVLNRFKVSGQQRLVLELDDKTSGTTKIDDITVFNGRYRLFEFSTTLRYQYIDARDPKVVGSEFATAVLLQLIAFRPLVAVKLGLRNHPLYNLARGACSNIEKELLLNFLTPKTLKN